MVVQTPRQWLAELSSAVTSTSCQSGGKPVPVETGLAHFQSQLRLIRKRDAAVWWVGNGGSASLCAHFSQDVMNKLKMRSMVLADASLITCMANDFGYENVYARPLETMARRGDLLVAISSSGRSENIMACARLARKKGLRLATFSSFKKNNPLWKHPADIKFHVPCTLYGLAEIGHAALLHSAIETLCLEESSKS